jgi:hypothetical protein
MAHRGGRIIDTDLRISRALHVSNDSQEREQGSQDDPNVKAHQFSCAECLKYFISNTQGILDGVGDVLVSTEFGSAWD